jgi:two-component system, NtrC family, response regulator HydG
VLSCGEGTPRAHDLTPLATTSMTDSIMTYSSDGSDPRTRTRSPAMRHLWELAAKVAPTTSTVLITGESGVGKERVAQWLHKASRRRTGPFLAVNCGAFADTLLESELFGHARGAFTGATQPHQGVFESAHRGTLMLDEIGDVSAAMQLTLLRVLQEREVRRLGDTAIRRVDVRLLAATHRDLRFEMAQQRFREDLYYRLSVFTLAVPPLRERLEDLPGLAHELLAQVAARVEHALVGFTPRALDCLIQYRWPGNVRELEHALERASVVATGPLIDVDDLPETVREPAGALAVKSLHELRVDHMRATLQRNRGNHRRTAAQMGISVATLRRHLRSKPTGSK